MWRESETSRMYNLRHLGYNHSQLVTSTSLLMATTTLALVLTRSPLEPPNLGIGPAITPSLTSSLVTPLTAVSMEFPWTECVMASEVLRLGT